MVPSKSKLKDGLFHWLMVELPNWAKLAYETYCAVYERDAISLCFILQTFWTALHWAADRGNDELVYILLDAGIDPTIRDMVCINNINKSQFCRFSSC